MAERVPVSIKIGGTLTPSQYAELTRIARRGSLTTEWGGECFQPEDRIDGQPLSLYAEEVAGGSYDELEAWCIRQGLPFVRWSGGCSGQWMPERAVFTGEGEPGTHIVDEDDNVVLTRRDVIALGSIDAIFASFDAADFSPPSLIVEGV